MRRRSLLQLALAVTAVALTTMPSAAQEQPVRIIFPFAAGGSGDALTRLVAEKLRVGLNRTVVVENRTGGAGRIGVQAVKSATPDGNTVLVTAIAPMAVYQHIYKPLGYDPITDFQAVTQLGTFEFGVAVGQNVPAKSVKELVDWAKANPAQGNFGIPSAGSLPHFLGIMFSRTAGLDLRAVAYRGAAAAVQDLVAGQIPLVFMGTNDLVEMHKAGRIRVLATSDQRRSPFLPDLPTFRESGFDLQGTGWYGVFVPAGTSAAVVDRLNKVIVAAVQSPDVRERFLGFGLQPTGTTAAAFAAIVKADADLWGPAVRASGFTPEQ